MSKERILIYEPAWRPKGIGLGGLPEKPPTDYEQVKKSLDEAGIQFQERKEGITQIIKTGTVEMAFINGIFKETL